ncbi:MAG: hypothetical protein K2R93_16010 [Gemmatimonadaceae bacterium]|nr:hypothetical protein [Gemmatimonadaceae bacterium]
MSQFHDRPAKPEARTPPSHRKRLASAEVQRSLTARRRFEVARVAAEAGPRPCDMVRAVRKIHATLDGWVPTRPTICALAEIYRNGPDQARTDPAYYLIQHGGGRPRAKLDDALMDVLDDALAVNPRLETGKAIKLLAQAAVRCAVDLPGEWALRRIIEEARGGVLGRSAGGHGRRAAEVDAVPHDTLPYDRPHDCWTEDELVFPLWVGLWHEQQRRWVSTLLYVALVLDYVSRAILAWQVCDPRRRRGAQGEVVVTGFDEHDVATVFLRASQPDIAPAFMRPFTGFLPKHIRLDGHVTHRAWSKAVQPHIPSAIHILSAYRPYRNGSQERCGFTVKEEFDAFFAGIPGHVQTHIPTDRLRQNPHEARVEAAATTDRPARKIEILPEDLPRVEDVDRIILPKLIEHYNFERRHSAHGTTPYDAFMAQRPRASLLTPSDALLRALPVVTLTSTKGSLQMQRDNRLVAFDHRIRGRIVPVGATVTAHVHPLATCLWAVEDSGRALVHVPGLRDASASRDGHYIARARAEMTGGLSERAQRAIHALMDQRLGVERAAETRAAADQNIAADPAARRAPSPEGVAGTVDLTSLIAAAVTTPLRPEDVWLGARPARDTRDGDPPAAAVRAADAIPESMYVSGAQLTPLLDEALRQATTTVSAPTPAFASLLALIPGDGAAAAPPRADAVEGGSFWLAGLSAATTPPAVPYPSPALPIEDLEQRRSG